MNLSTSNIKEELEEQNLMILADFHQHSLFSDGVLLPSEIIRRHIAKGFDAIAITDHVDNTSIDFVIANLDKVKNDFKNEIIFIPGVEITHVPPHLISKLAKKAKDAGYLVIVHGETVVEPVKKGTNISALSCSDVDILAHPGMITKEEVKLAKENNIFLELTIRAGHSLTNGLVAKFATKIGADLIIDSDAHLPSEFLSENRINFVAKGAGLDENDLLKITRENTRKLLKRFEYYI